MQGNVFALLAACVMMLDCSSCAHVPRPSVRRMAAWEDLKRFEFRADRNTTRIWHPKIPQIVCGGPRCVPELTLITCVALLNTRPPTPPPKVLRGSQIMRRKNRDPEAPIDWEQVTKELLAPVVRLNYTCTLYSGNGDVLEALSLYSGESIRVQISCEGYHWAYDSNYVTVESCGVTYWFDTDQRRLLWCYATVVVLGALVAFMTVMRLARRCNRLNNKRPPWV